MEDSELEADVSVAADGVIVVPADREKLAVLRRTGRDHLGNRVDPFVDDDGGWPLRCCLRDSMPGEVIAIVAWCPFPWSGPYSEIGPIVVHAGYCGGRAETGIPAQFLKRPQLLRPYGHDQRIAYDDIMIADGEGTLPGMLAALVARDHVDFVLVRNVRTGCYSFTATPA